MATDELALARCLKRLASRGWGSGNQFTYEVVAELLENGECSLSVETLDRVYRHMTAKRVSTLDSIGFERRSEDEIEPELKDESRRTDRRKYWAASESAVTLPCLERALDRLFGVALRGQVSSEDIAEVVDACGLSPLEVRQLIEYLLSSGIDASQVDLTELLERYLTTLSCIVGEDSGTCDSMLEPAWYSQLSPWIFDGNWYQDAESVSIAWSKSPELLLRCKLVLPWEAEGYFQPIYEKVKNVAAANGRTSTVFRRIGQLFLRLLVGSKSKTEEGVVSTDEASATMPPVAASHDADEVLETPSFEVGSDSSTLGAGHGHVAPKKEAYSSESLISRILEERFPNGIRPRSLIDINKLRAYYRDSTGGEDISTDALDLLLRTVGVPHGEKVFAIPLSGQNALVERVKQLIARGNRLYYYEEFYDAHADLLRTMNIHSAELLKTVLSRLLPSLRYRKNYFATRDVTSVESEVRRCFKVAVLLSYEEIEDRLPYVPIDKIRQVLALNSDFIWVRAGVYTHVNRVKIDTRERASAEAFILAEIAERGFASLASVNVAASLELNPDLSETAVKNGLFRKCFAGRYEKRGNIITPRGATLNAVSVLRQYCLEHRRLTLAELLELEKELNGRVHSQSLFVAYDTMIRVDKDTFVCDSEIMFDVYATDQALAPFLHKDVIPLQAVTSFASFPYIDGYSWNLYLLESYCRRFSEKFMYQCLSVNSMNVGAIFRRSAGFADYIEVLASAIADSGVELDEKTVGNYLFENRYVAQRTRAVSRVVAKARILRERGV